MASNIIPVEVVNCDLCTCNTLNWAPAASNEDRLKFLRKKQNPLLAAGYRIGTVEEALAAGWEERDYGVVCPGCIVEEQAQAQRDEEEQAESGFFGPEIVESLTGVTVEASAVPQDARSGEGQD